MSYYVVGPPLPNGRCTSLLRAPVSEMTYTVSSGTLNSTIDERLGLGLGNEGLGLGIDLGHLDLVHIPEPKPQTS